jgi:Ca2+-binding RTX toxin-like protein
MIGRPATVMAILVSAQLSMGNLSLAHPPALVGAVCFGKPVTLQGTTGVDNLVGNPGRDVIQSLGGDDRIDGEGGDDFICAGTGNDYVVGGGGNDRLDGQGGADTVSFFESKGVSVDLALGRAIGAGRDRLTNIERILGSPRKDTLKGNFVPNVLHGLAGPDALAGRGGKDTLNGGIGADSLDGGANRDSCIGGRGVDSVRRCERLTSVP